MTVGLVIVVALAALAAAMMAYKVMKAGLFFAAVAAVTYYVYPHIDTLAGPFF